MSTPSQDDIPIQTVQGEHQRIIAPLRLFFWGMIICIIDFRLNGFDIFNNFVGMLMILWGVVSLSHIPISERYQRWMMFVVVIAIFDAVCAFYGEILFPLYLIRILFPVELTFAINYFVVLFSVWGTVVFCRCMLEYCDVVNWERTYASWEYSARLFFYGILLPTIILAIPLFILVTSLNFVPKNSLPRLYGWSVTVGEWVAPVDQTIGMIVTLPLMLFVVVAIWTIIHFLMSVSRMIRAAKNADSQSYILGSVNPSPKLPNGV